MDAQDRERWEKLSAELERLRGCERERDLLRVKLARAENIIHVNVVIARRSAESWKRLAKRYRAELAALPSEPPTRPTELLKERLGVSFVDIVDEPFPWSTATDEQLLNGAREGDEVEVETVRGERFKTFIWLMSPPPPVARWRVVRIIRRAGEAK